MIQEIGAIVISVCIIGAFVVLAMLGKPQADVMAALIGALPAFWFGAKATQNGTRATNGTLSEMAHLVENSQQNAQQAIVAGARGPQGIAGPQGPTGPQGEPGKVA